MNIRKVHTILKYGLDDPQFSVKLINQTYTFIQNEMPVYAVGKRKLL